MATSQNPLARRRHFNKGQWKEQEGEDDKRRDGKITSRNGREWDLEIPWGQRKTVKDGKVLLQRHLLCPTTSKVKGMRWEMMNFRCKIKFSPWVELRFQIIILARKWITLPVIWIIWLIFVMHRCFKGPRDVTLKTGLFWIIRRCWVCKQFRFTKEEMRSDVHFYSCEMITMLDWKKKKTIRYAITKHSNTTPLYSHWKRIAQRNKAWPGHFRHTFVTRE